MITLEPQVEKQLQTLASEKGVSISELIKNLMFDHQSEQEAINLADNAYSGYKKTGEAIILDQLMKNNNLDN
ncbi:MAG: hypothetical protein GQ532_15995 [Methylomarinum sp.]|nr:hypothetical protein [Methylomarinum sp.]